MCIRIGFQRYTVVQRFEQFWSNMDSLETVLLLRSGSGNGARVQGGKTINNSNSNDNNLIIDIRG